MHQQLRERISHSKTVTRIRRSWLTIAFILGFVVDNLTLNRVDQVFDNVILFSHVSLSATALLLLYAGTAGKLGDKYSQYARLYAPIVIQYTFGGLLSGMLIFYGRSGAWVESWPFMAVIIAAIYFNETIRDRTSRFLYNVTIFFIGLFSYVILVIPVVTGMMGPWIFVGSGLIALMLMYFFVQLLYKIIPRFLELQMRAVVFSLGCVFVGFNFLYFTNIIPPIPLSLKEVGIFHSVIRFDTGVYQLKYEKGAWWQPFRNSNDVFHPVPGGDVFCFARVFAPTRLETKIEHHWEYYDEAKEEWQTHGRFGYSIEGGRGDGFRGYTLIQNFRDGKWRCSVETERGQVLGRETFIIDSTESVTELVTRAE